MILESELQLISETMNRFGIRVTLLDSNRPVMDYADQLLAVLSLSHQHRLLTWKQLLPALQPATVYTVCDFINCCYTYLLLPKLGQETLLFIGPYLSEGLSEEKLLEQAEAWGLPQSRQRQLEKFYGSLPLMDGHSHFHILLETFFIHLWGQDGYTTQQISQAALYESLPLQSDLPISDQAQEQFDLELMEKRYAQENTLMEAVRLGQMQKIEALLPRIQNSAFQQRLPDQVRNIKNYCIISNTLMRKAAEQGGVHPIYLDRVSSGFALKIEQLTDARQAGEMVIQIARAYCRLVQEHATKSYCPTVQRAVLLIDGDLSADLSLSALAQRLNVSRSYLSTLFKEQTGMTLTQYVTRQRLRYARKLLKTTRLQVQTVAAYCGILDMHYFTKLFRQEVGMTPRQYRDSMI